MLKNIVQDMSERAWYLRDDVVENLFFMFSRDDLVEMLHGVKVCGNRNHSKILLIGRVLQIEQLLAKFPDGLFSSTLTKEEYYWCVCFVCACLF